MLRGLEQHLHMLRDETFLNFCYLLIEAVKSLAGAWPEFGLIGGEDGLDVLVANRLGAGHDVLHVVVEHRLELEQLLFLADVRLQGDDVGLHISLDHLALGSHLLQLGDLLLQELNVQLLANPRLPSRLPVLLQLLLV